MLLRQLDCVHILYDAIVCILVTVLRYLSSVQLVKNCDFSFLNCTFYFLKDTLFLEIFKHV